MAKISENIMSKEFKLKFEKNFSFIKLGLTIFIHFILSITIGPLIAVFLYNDYFLNVWVSLVRIF